MRAGLGSGNELAVGEVQAPVAAQRQALVVA